MKFNRWTWILALVFAVVAADAFAQRGSLRIKLVDEEGNPIGGIQCSVEPSNGGRAVKAKTKDNGELVRGGFRSGAYTVTCEKEGYRKLAIGGQVSAYDQLDLGEHIMYRLQPGELSEADHARATELLEKFNMSAETGDNEATLKHLMELSELMPDSPEVNFNIAGTYEKMGDTEKAIEFYTKTTDLKSDFYEAWLAIGDLQGKAGNWAEAEAAMKKAIDIKAEDPIAVFNYSVFAQNAGDSDAAEAGFNKVLELDPNQAVAHYQLGLIAVAKQQNDEAIAHFEKFLALAPDHPQAEAAKGVIQALQQKSQ
jgi:tetratricopeptide (TPR) repeat protein